MSTGNGTTIGYTIEVRSTHLPKVLGRTIVAGDWVELPVGSGPDGVPNRLWCPLAAHVGLQTFETAMALTAWAAAEAGFASCLEFRLVKKALKYQYTVEDVGAGEPMNFHEMERAAIFAKAPA